MKAEVELFLMECVAQLTGKSELKEHLDEKTALQEVGIDSVAMINLVVMIEQKYNAFYDDDELLEENFSNIGVISGRLLEKLGTRI